MVRLMLKNYFEINENATVGTFLKELNDKKNMQYIILETSPKSFVDIRTIGLKVHHLNEKLKGLKKSLAWVNAKSQEEKLNFLIDSGDRVIETQDGFYDFIDALKYIQENDFDFLNKKICDNVLRKEIFALTQNDMISTARNLFIKKRINLLPVIDNLKLIGEVRTMDFLIANLFDSSKDKSDYYNDKIADSALNMPIENLINEKPITIENTEKIKNALNLMINKKLASIIVTEGENLYSILSYKDIFRYVKKGLEKSKYTIEYIGSSDVYDDEFDLIQDYAEKSMKKISNMSNYDNLRVSLKLHGNSEGSHQRKISVKLLLSHGNHVLHIDKEIVSGSSDEEFNDKVKGSWNVPQTVQEAFNALEKQVKEEKRKNK
ncbi:MAG: CBS domain-containing protein [Nanoarchaeota archaeon]|nr:CBS domain-containing protein [Nanoarchaeota archaeon]